MIDAAEKSPLIDGKVSLKASGFFKKYIIHPLSEELTTCGKIAALVLSVIFIPLTMGLLHISCQILENKFIAKSREISVKTNADFDKTIKKVNSLGIKNLSPNKGFSYKQSNISKIVNDDFIVEMYSKEQPKHQDILVPNLDEKSAKKFVKWSSYNREQKIAVLNKYALPHDQISKNTLEYFVDQKLYGWCQYSGINGDPRESHGNDHGARAAMFSAVFAYMYFKYHPEYAKNPDQKTVLLAQLAGAGHDCARQAEGPDLFDDLSAESTKEILLRKNLPEEDAEICAQAIMHKDAKDLKNKSLVAKCLQNADSVEFRRLFNPSSALDDKKMESSRNYLDIFNEFKEMANNDPTYVLANGLTYGDFMKELSLMQKQMNLMIAKTHSDKNRAKRTKKINDGSYYQSFIDKPSSGKYSAIKNALEKVGVVKTTGKMLIPENRVVENRQSSSLNNEVKRRHDLLKKSLACRGESLAHARSLVADAEALLKLTTNDQVRMTTALAFKDAANLYLMKNMPTEALKALKLAGREIKLDENNALYNPFLWFDGKSGDNPEFRKRGTVSSFEQGILRASVKKIKGEKNKQLEVTVPLTLDARAKLQKLLEVQIKQKAVSVKHDERVFFGKDFLTGEYDKEKKMFVGDQAHYINFPNSKVQAIVGAPSQYMVSQNRLTLTVPIKDEKIDLDGLHEAFSTLGLPEALLLPRDEDIKDEALEKSLEFRFPSFVLENKGSKPEEIYEKLSKANKEKIDDDIVNMERNKGTFLPELINPKIAQEAKAKGARGLIHFVNGGDKKATLNLIPKLLEGAVLSAEERFEKGIFTRSTCPNYNDKTGSSAKVFARALAEKAFTDEVSLDQFPINGGVAFLFKPELFERLPYSYLHDRGGVRNPEYSNPVHWPQGATLPELRFHGSSKMKERQGIDELLNELGEKSYPLTETIFDRAVEIKYLNRILVRDEYDRLNLLKVLERSGITEVNGVRIQDVVVATKTLTPDLINPF